MLGLRLSRHWNQSPFWFGTLSQDEKTAVYAEYCLHYMTPEDRESRAKKVKKADIKWKRERMEQGVRWKKQ